MFEKFVRKAGRPRKNPDSLRITQSFCIDSTHLDFIRKQATEQSKSTSDVLNILIDNVRKLRGE